MSACPKENGEFLEKEVRESSVLLFELFQLKLCLLCVIPCSLTAKMTLLTGIRCGRTSAERSFTKLCRELFAYGIHGIDHLIQRDELGDTGQ